MKKRYKTILFFVWLMAMNNTVHAQLGSISASAHGVALTSNYTASSLKTNPFGYPSAGIGSLYGVWTNDVFGFTNYPNPATTETTIAYTLSEKAFVTIKVIDLAGKQLAVLLKKEIAAGKNEFYWQFSKNNITSGMYILILQVGNKNYSRKIIVQ